MTIERSEFGNELLLDLIIGCAIDPSHLCLEDAKDWPMVGVANLTPPIVNLRQNVIMMVENSITPGRRPPFSRGVIH